MYTVVMEQSNHQMYKAHSPYYQSILASEGRWLSEDVVESILRDHSITLDQYEEEEGGLHKRTDAAELLAWLGY